MKNKTIVTHKPMHQRTHQDVVNERMYRLNRERARRERKRELRNTDETVRRPAFSLHEKEWAMWVLNTVRDKAIPIIMFVVIYTWIVINTFGS